MPPSNKITCPECVSTDVKVIDSRCSPEGSYRRRRKCNACGHRWSTYEITQEDWAKFKAINDKTGDFIYQFICDTNNTKNKEDISLAHIFIVLKMLVEKGIILIDDYQKELKKLMRKEKHG